MLNSHYFGNFHRLVGATASSAILYLYVFELIYKTSINVEMAIHHSLTILGFDMVSEGER